MSLALQAGSPRAHPISYVGSVRRRSLSHARRSARRRIAAPAFALAMRPAVNGRYLRWPGQGPDQCNHNLRLYCAIRPRR